MARKEKEMIAGNGWCLTPPETSGLLAGADLLAVLTRNLEDSPIDRSRTKIGVRAARVDAPTAFPEADAFCPTHILAQADKWKL